MSDNFSVHIRDIKCKVTKFLHIKRENETFYNLFKKSLQELNGKIRQKPSGILSYMQDYEIILGFEDFYKRRDFPINKSIIAEKENLRKFINFALSLLEIYQSVNSKIKSKLSGHLKKGLNQGKLLPFQHEIETYVHLSRKGYSLQWEDGYSEKKYEFTAIKNNCEFAVECKTISRYAGAAIIEEASHSISNEMWEIVRNKVDKPSIIYFSFEGKLTTHGKDSYSPDSFIEDFRYKLDTNDSDIIVEEIKNEEIFNYKWLEETGFRISESKPFATIMVPLPKNSVDFLICPIIIVLNPKSTSGYIDEFNKQIDKALTQIQGNMPGIIYLYPEGLTPTLIKNLQTKISEIINLKISNIKQPLMCCVRTSFVSHQYGKNMFDEEGQYLSLYNKPFIPFYKLLHEDS